MKRNVLHLVLCALAVGIAGAVYSVVRTSEGEQPPSRKPVSVTLPKAPGEPFVILTKDQLDAKIRRSGEVLVNVYQLTGDWRSTIEKLEKIKGERKITVYLCAGNQPKGMKEFVPLLDQLTIWAYKHSSNVKPGNGDLVWPDYDHPLVNRLREIRKKVSGKSVIAHIHTKRKPGDTVWGMPAGRAQSFEEIKWRVLAVIGANFDGISWYGGIAHSPWHLRLRDLQNRLLLYAHDLRSAEPVDWVRAPKGQPVSALATRGKLFVVLLNPDYMKPDGSGKSIPLPMNPWRPAGQIEIRLPKGMRIAKGQTLWGMNVMLSEDKSATKAEYHLCGGAEMLAFDLEGGAQ